MISPADAILCSFDGTAPVCLQPTIRFLDWSRPNERIRIVRQPAELQVIFCFKLRGCYFGPMNGMSEINDHLVKKGPKPLLHG